MLRAVVDPGVLISALISARGAPAEVVRRWLDGSVQVIWSPALLAEFESVCSRPRFREWFTLDEARAIADLVRRAGERADDVRTDAPPPPDGGDRYLVDLAVSFEADCLVTGDGALLDHRSLGVRTVNPRALIRALDALENG